MYMLSCITFTVGSASYMPIRVQLVCKSSQIYCWSQKLFQSSTQWWQYILCREKILTYFTLQGSWPQMVRVRNQFPTGQKMCIIWRQSWKKKVTISWRLWPLELWSLISQEAPGWSNYHQLSRICATTQQWRPLLNDKQRFQTSLILQVTFWIRYCPIFGSSCI